MKTFFYWFFLISLIAIHTIDMELTTHEIGDQWERENFYLMQLCIKYFGIFHAVWISRIVMYLYFAVSYRYKSNDYFIFTMFLLALLYWAAMIDWLFTL